MKCGNPLERACAKCGQGLPADADFCLKCGARFESGAPPANAPAEKVQLQQYIPAELLAKLRSVRAGAGMQGERRVVTILFCDVKGSTAAAERLDPEEWHEIMNGAFKHLIAPVYRYEGTLARLMGDAILAFFGAPIAHEDDPLRAVMAALEMVDGIRPYREEVKRKWGIEFDVRAGINTGLVVVGEVGSDLRVEYTAMGDAVNLASRMESTALPGTVQVAEATHRLVAPLVDSEPLGEIDVKGKSAPVAAFRVKGLKERPGSLRGIVGVESPMVGREKEFQALKDATEELRRGRGGVVSLIAEAGLGKSRLAAEWRRWLNDTNEAAALAGTPGTVRLCEGRSLSFESGVPYAPFISAFTACTGIRRGMDEETKYRAILDHIAEAAPEALPVAPFIASLLGVRPSGEEAERVQYLPPAQLRAEVFRAVVRYYESLAARTPVALLIDDLHWADPTSLELLKELLPLSDRAPFLMLTLFRPSQQEPSWTFHETAARDFPHRYVSLQILPLAESDSRQLVANLLHVEGLPVSVRNLILAKSEGNPFFVEEVIRSLIDSGVVTRDGDRWVATREVERFAVPDSLSALLTTRLDRLDESTRRLAQTAAVIGREFDESSLRAVLPDGVDLDRGLGELQRRGLVRERGRNPERLFAFKHVLVQDSAYNSILLKNRRGLHLQVAEALLAGPAPEPDSVSRHLLAADERVRAIPYLVAAAKHAARTASVAEAVTKYERAISLVQESPDRSQARAAFEGLFDLYKFTGNVEKASAMTERMLQYAESVGDATMKVSAMNKSGFVLAMFRGALDAADEVLARSETLARKERDLAGLAEMNTIHCYIQVSQGRLDKAEGHLREAAEIGKELGAEEPHLFGLTHSANCMVYLTRFEDARKEADEALRLAEKTGNRHYQSEIRVFSLPYLEMVKGDLQSARAIAERGVDIAARIGTLMHEADGCFWLGQIARLQGEYDRAVEMFRRCGRTSAQVPFLSAAALCFLGSVQLDLSDTELLSAAVDFHRQSREIMAGPMGGMLGPLLWAEMGMSALAAGNLDGADALFEKSLDAASPATHLARPMVLLGMVAAALRRGDAAAAGKAAAAARKYVDAKGMRHFLPAVLLHEGMVAEAVSAHDSAARTFEAASTTAREMGMRPVLWQALAGRARALDSLGRGGEAGSLRSEAKEVVGSIAAGLRDETLKSTFRAGAEAKVG